MALSLAYAELKKAEESLRKMNLELEERVEERTSELKNEKAEAERRNAELRKINSDLDNFIYTASHDLKAPISNIEGLVNEIKGSHIYDEDELHPLVDMMSSSIDRFKNTISELTEITKVQRGFNEDIEIIDIKELFEEVQEGLIGPIRENETEIEFNFDKAPVISFTKKNLRSIIYNLLSNAVKYRSPDRKPFIRVTTQPAGDYTLLTVEDNGLGIAPSQIGKIFSMFKRLHDHVEGSGIGLYIVKRMIENGGGKIEVESALGKGTAFKVYFKNR
jgi:signal transduction histidine kinase